MSPKLSSVLLKTSQMPDHHPSLRALNTPNLSLVRAPFARSNQVFFIHSSLDTPPLAVLKTNPQNHSKLLPELHTLAFLNSHHIPLVPSILSHHPGELLLSYIPHAQHNLAKFSSTSIQQLACWLASLHALRPTTNSENSEKPQLKLLDDPLPLHQRLSKILAKTTRRARSKHTLSTTQYTLVELATQRFQSLLTQPHVQHELAIKPIAHRDINPHNILLDPHTHHLCGVIDFERAAATSPAWDFVKLKWWLLDQLPSSHTTAFLEAYTQNLSTPHIQAIELFTLFEAITLLCVFAKSPQSHYVQGATSILNALTQNPPPTHFHELPSWPHTI